MPVTAYQKTINEHKDDFNQCLSDSRALLHSTKVKTSTPIFLLTHNNEQLKVWDSKQGWTTVIQQLPEIISQIQPAQQHTHDHSHHGHHEHHGHHH